MAEFDANRNTRNDGYGMDFVHSVTLHHKLTERLDGYVEYVGGDPGRHGQQLPGQFRYRDGLRPA